MEWRAWAAAHGLRSFDTNGGLGFDLMEPAPFAAVRRYGVVLLDSTLIAEDLETGRLVVPFKSHMPSLGSYRIVYTPSMSAQPRLRSFRDWILDEFRTV